MKKAKSGKKVFTLIVVSGLVLVLAADLGFSYLDSLMVSKIRGCELKSRDFQETMPFEMVGGYMVVEAKVGGRKRSFPFIFDSSSRSVFTDSLLLQITQKDYKVFAGELQDTLKHAFNDDFICMNQVQIGKVQFENVGALTAYGSKWGALNCISPYGVIGYNVIGSCTVQIDYERQEITLTDQVESLANFSDISWTAYQSFGQEQHPIIAAEVDGKLTLDLFVNTGSPHGAVLSSDSIYRALQGDTRARAFEFRPAIRIHGESDDTQKALLLDAVEVELADALQSTVPVSVIKQPQKVFGGYLGNRFLRNFNLTFAGNRLGLIPVQRNEGPQTTLGFQAALDGEQVLVSALAMESGLTLTDVEVGDKIRTVQGMDPLLGDPCRFLEHSTWFDSRNDSIVSVEILHSDSVLFFELTPENTPTLFD